ncbi:MAG: hypothetical protein AAB885_01740 [Patescibacteria group bacterium]
MTDKKVEQPDLDLAAEFHEKMGEASARGLTYQNKLEKRNADLIKEGEELMAKRAQEKVQTKSKLQILRETLTGWVKRK